MGQPSAGLWERCLAAAQIEGSGGVLAPATPLTGAPAPPLTGTPVAPTVADAAPTPAPAVSVKPRGTKGKNFTDNEERQVCRSFLAISRDPITGVGQKANVFWDRVFVHYNHHKPEGCPTRPARSLDTKWGHIRHDVAKFNGCYEQVVMLKESGTSMDDNLQKALALYRLKNPNKPDFVYLHCWFVLREVPRWQEMPVDATKIAVHTPSLTRKRKANRGSMAASGSGEYPPSAGGAGDQHASAVAVGGDNACEFDMDDDHGLQLPPAAGAARPLGSRAAKEQLRLSRSRENLAHVQAKATADIAKTNRDKVQLMADQSALQLFSMPVDSALGDDAREYLFLRRREELNRIKRRVAADDAAMATARSIVTPVRCAARVASTLPPASTLHVFSDPPLQAASRPASIDPVITDPLEVESHSPDGTQVEYETRLDEDSSRSLNLNSKFFPCDV